MISVVIPLYDKAKQVAATLDSVRRQTFSAYEVVIVDDGSTDGSLDVVRDYLLEYSTFSGCVRIYSQQHAGVSAARNKGIDESRYGWIAFLDADDTWAPEYLQAQTELSRKYPGCEILASAYEFTYGAGGLEPATFSKFTFAGTDGILDNYFEVAACSHPPLSSLTTIVRKKSIQAIGGFPESISSGEDLLTWGRLAIYNRIAFNRKSLGQYNRDHSQFNRDQRERLPARNDVVGYCLENLYRRHPAVKGLRQYVGVWYKMRARIYLANAMKREAWKEWKKMLRFAPDHYKTWVYLAVLVSPVKVLS